MGKSAREAQKARL